MDNENLRSVGCDEYEDWTRRRFLMQSSRSTLSTVATPAWLPRVVLSGAENSRDTLVVVFLRGAMDSLYTIPPHGDPNYYAPNLRDPTLRIPPPGDPGGATDLDGFFGLAPQMSALLPAYQSGQLLVVHAAGSPDPSRSHFDAFSNMEYGTPLQTSDLYSGWLARHLQMVPSATGAALRAVALSDLIPKTLAEAPATLPIADPAGFGFPGRAIHATERREALQLSYSSADDPLPAAAQSTLDTIDLLGTIDFQNYAPVGGAAYPETPFGNSFKSVAAMVKADIGLEAAMLERGGWDTHSDQVGPIQTLMTDLSNAMAAFHVDMQNFMNRLTLVVMTEFGRRADSNGSAGTDHGHGSAMMVMGGNIDGGRVLANWTDGALLHPDLLYQGDSLDVTTDYRDIVAEILQNRLENPSMSDVFPNYTPTFQGITI